MMWGHNQPILMAAAHPTEVLKLVIMEHVFPGFTPPQLEGKVWWFRFHLVPDLPEGSCHYQRE